MPTLKQATLANDCSTAADYLTDARRFLMGSGGYPEDTIKARACIDQAGEIIRELEEAL